jgi:hypothetical protein
VLGFFVERYTIDMAERIVLARARHAPCPIEHQDRFADVVSNREVHAASRRLSISPAVANLVHVARHSRSEAPAEYHHWPSAQPNVGVVHVGGKSAHGRDDARASPVYKQLVGRVVEVFILDGRGIPLEAATPKRIVEVLIDTAVNVDAAEHGFRRPSHRGS